MVPRFQQGLSIVPINVRTITASSISDVEMMEAAILPAGLAILQSSRVASQL
jgi:hypothetical protein